MPDYRIYVIDRLGHIVAPREVITCDSDKEAIQKAEAFKDGRPLEVWDRDRIVARLEPDPP